MKSLHLRKGFGKCFTSNLRNFYIGIIFNYLKLQCSNSYNFVENENYKCMQTERYYWYYY